MKKVTYKYWPYTKQRSRSRVRSDKVTKTKYCSSIVRHMFYGSFGTQNSMLTCTIKFDLRKGQLQVKLGQIKSNFKIRNCLTKICLSCATLSRDSKNVFFSCATITNANNCISKNVRSSHLPFFCHYTPKNKDIAFKFCLHVVRMYFDHVYSVFWIL